MDFTTWMLRRQKLLPQPDRLIVLIRAAGRNGIAEPELRSAVDLPRNVVDDLLMALVQSGQVGVVERGGRRWYLGR